MAKLKNSFFYLLMLTVVFCMASCSSDDDPAETPAVTEIAGSYAGYNKMVFSYMPDGMYTNGDVVTITANSDGTATVKYDNDSWKSTLTAVSVTRDAAGYKLTGTGKMSMGMHNGKTTEYDCTLSGTISADKKTCELVYTLPAVMNGTTITFSLGDAPAQLYLAGSYTGWAAMSMAYGSQNFDGQKVTLKGNDDGTLTVVYESDNWSSTLSAVTVTKTDNGYQLTGEGTMNMGMNPNSKKDYACTLSGTISADKKTYNLVWTLPSVMQGTTITFQQGNAPTTDK